MILSSCASPYETVPLIGFEADNPIPEEFRERILVDTVHDGDVVPMEFRVDKGVPLVDPDELEARYVEERDWGANLVAAELAKSLGLPGFCRMRLARVLLDFNRFPGSTPPGLTDPLERLAINAPFSTALDHPLKMRLLGYYDQVSDRIEAQFHGKLIRVCVHTYDMHNASRTVRPDVSLITQSVTYNRESCMPYGIFDPLYPPVLAESTCSRVLRDRIALNLERGGFRVGHNHPYLLPDGSTDIRSQVWYFFTYVRERFLAEHPECTSDEAYARVWTMLLNTNLRRIEGEELRGYLHRYRRPHPTREPELRRAQLAYEVVGRFIRESGVIDEYRRHPERPSSLTVEVRKDLLNDFDASGRPTRRHTEVAAALGRTIAGAIRIYFETDRPLATGG
ncbi:MAG: N-formylglutamate amidohydrolase [Planctomycetes bacterium]|nr:N-formylglutamate amidohydrolase [Planctomycetota bacterium]